MSRSLNILQISTQDIGGGAEKVAWNLFSHYRQRGCRSWLVVGRKLGDDRDVFPISNSKLIETEGRTLRMAGNALSHPHRYAAAVLGFENFHYPATRRLLDLVPARPDIIHAHNLHGEYFDLRELVNLGKRAPVVMTLHDAWLLSGHCAHSFDCLHWETGCGKCPYLSTPPSVRRDATARNWRKKRNIYARSRLYIATPCQWLMDKVNRSMLAPAMLDTRVIANGVDVSVFHASERRTARSALRILEGASVVLFAAKGTRANPFKDYEMLSAAVARASQLGNKNLVFVALGEAGQDLRVGGAEIRFVPFEHSEVTVASYYRAADIYLHAARADTFPTSILEALACGTPVIATAVGGIPEQVKSLWAGASFRDYHIDEATGVLVAPGDVDAMARAIVLLQENVSLARRLGENAAADARQRFDLQMQVDQYLGWYAEILDNA